MKTGGAKTTGSAVYYTQREVDVKTGGAKATGSAVYYTQR